LRNRGRTHPFKPRIDHAYDAAQVDDHPGVLAGIAVEMDAANLHRARVPDFNLRRNGHRPRRFDIPRAARSALKRAVRVVVVHRLIPQHGRIVGMARLDDELRICAHHAHAFNDHVAAVGRVGGVALEADEIFAVQRAGD